METRRSKRKEAAASETLPPEPRSKRARRAQAESKAKANTNNKAKVESSGAGTSGVSDSDPVHAPQSAVLNTVVDLAPVPAASEPAEVSTSQSEQATTRKSLADLDKDMAARKDLGEAQERAAMEQVNWNVTCPNLREMLPGLLIPEHVVL